MKNPSDTQSPNLSDLIIGSIVDVVVDKTPSYGIWCKKDGIEILVLIPEVSWNIYESRSYCRDLASCFPVGSTIRVKITGFIPEKNQYVASIKEAQPELDPKKHPGYFVGAVWKGKISSIVKKVSAGEPFYSLVIDLLPGRFLGTQSFPVDEMAFQQDQDVHVKIVELREAHCMAIVEILSNSEIPDVIFEADPSEWEKSNYFLELLRADVH